MAEASVSLADDKTLFVQGKIHFGNVLSLLNKGKLLLDSLAEVKVDLAGVTQTDSSGLSLLIRWMQYATKQQKKISFLNLPSCLSDLGRVSGVDTILPIVVHS